MAYASVCVDPALEMAITMKVSPDLTIFVCGHENKIESKKLNKKSFTGVWILAQNKKGEIKKLFERGEIDDGQFISQVASNQLKIEKSWSFLILKDRPVIISQTLSCDNKKCTMSKESCSPKIHLDKNPNPEALTLLKQFLGNPKYNPKIDPNLDSLQGQVMDQALSGDKKAQAYFETKQRPTGADGALAEEWGTYAYQLGKLKKLGCLD